MIPGQGSSSPALTESNALESRLLTTTKALRRTVALPYFFFIESGMNAAPKNPKE